MRRKERRIEFLAHGGEDAVANPPGWWLRDQAQVGFDRPAQHEGLGRGVEIAPGITEFFGWDVAVLQLFAL